MVPGKQSRSEYSCARCGREKYVVRSGCRKCGTTRFGIVSQGRVRISCPCAPCLSGNVCCNTQHPQFSTHCRSHAAGADPKATGNPRKPGSCTPLGFAAPTKIKSSAAEWGKAALDEFDPPGVEVIEASRLGSELTKVFRAKPANLRSRGLFFFFAKFFLPGMSWSWQTLGGTTPAGCSDQETLVEERLSIWLVALMSQRPAPGNPV